MENADVSRIGKVASINYDEGTVKVVYKDRDDSTTTEIPYLSFEYMMPQIDDTVLVIHLSNGSEMAIVIGNFWNDEHRPFEGKEGLWRKEFSHKQDKAVARYADDEAGLFSLIVPRGLVRTYEKEFNIEAQGEIVVSTSKQLGVDVSRAVDISAGTNISLTASKSITLICGDTSIEMTSSGIVINASSLTVNAPTTFTKGTVGDRV